ncbi:DUF2934 domain-containing protein [Tropicimonas sp. TH_r6]|uniref:DUF2934 domain-containing protein n=1 Tax=Tropicimonas sp. TH_r6 TaxID=3082085 RepID=UPI002952E875|nr:DUF2934 domain-containing protein [Tropicimonas sp. TH_r6]MDV7142720.1 DUF2934 domain-containing protein [Tropicimonas sp. TH_r6]
MTQPNLTDDQIREAAYLFWLEEGQPHGRDEAHWLKAIDALSAPQPKKKARKAPAKPRASKSASKPASSKAATAKAASPKVAATPETKSETKAKAPAKTARKPRAKKTPSA